MMTVHDAFWAAVDTIERDCRVADWRLGDLDLWPLARQDLFLDMFRAQGGDTAPPPPRFLVRAVNGLATPAINLWRSRGDLSHWLPRAHRADIVMLGDGVSLDRIREAWHDRYGEPVAAALERRGRSILALQPGNLMRLPWTRPTLAVNTVAVRGAVGVALSPGRVPDLPDHDAVIDHLARAGIVAPSLTAARLARRAQMAAAHARAFERILARARPAFAFVITYYAGLGHAFALACRRRGVLCVDLQHCPQDGAHRAYRWPSLPRNGYTTLPGLFWTWSEGEAASIERWTEALDQPWHRALPGGHSQIAGFLQNAADLSGEWNRMYEAASGGRRATREILIALQPIGGQRAYWEALADTIAAAPSDWRWWIRRHPSSIAAQDADHARLLSLVGTNVVVEDAARLPLPVLMPRMSALVSLASGAAGEAAAFGVPAYFLSDDAGGPFAGLIARGAAKIVDPTALINEIARLPELPDRASVELPKTADTLDTVERMAEEYARLRAHDAIA